MKGKIRVEQAQVANVGQGVRRRKYSTTGQTEGSMRGYSEEQVKMNFVGVMDGDGSIYVGIMQGEYMRYELKIELKAGKENREMLEVIARVVGVGTIKEYEYSRGTRVVKWVAWGEE